MHDLQLGILGRNWETSILLKMWVYLLFIINVSLIFIVLRFTILILVGLTIILKVPMHLGV